MIMNPGVQRLYWIYRSYNHWHGISQCNKLQKLLSAEDVSAVRSTLAQLGLNQADPEVQWALGQIEAEIERIETQPQQLDLF